MRYELWDFESNEILASFGDEQTALFEVRSYLASQAYGEINRLGLVDTGAPKGSAPSVATYPLEGAALLAKVFGLEDGE